MKHIKQIAFILVLSLAVGMIPTVFAAQEDNYHDPAENWQTTSDRTNELDANAVVTYETFYCDECVKQTGFTVFRTPEYTRDGRSALTRSVGYSDGTLAGGEGKGILLDGTPGVNAYYSGFHWTKAVCENCGTINGNLGKPNYGFDKNVYWIFDCASEFLKDLQEAVTYEYADSDYHIKTTGSGKYCCFCYGTNKYTDAVMERHDLKQSIVPQPGNSRFALTESCRHCEFSRAAYVTAKSVIAGYYGVVDGAPHTVTVSDLSDTGVAVSIRYGNSAEACTLTSAPNYTVGGQYAVYYSITYTYGSESMTENGVAYVCLWDESGVEVDAPCAEGAHSFTYLETISPTCFSLGHERYLCVDCGMIEKRNYTAAQGHVWQGVLIRESTCETDGKLLEICHRCGEVKVSNTPRGEHIYETFTVAASCKGPGYSVRKCDVCGERQISDITNALTHDYKANVIPSTCTTGGKTSHCCSGCGSTFVTDYTAALGHTWDDGHVVTAATCDGSGVMEYHCVRCDYHRLEGVTSDGHTPGDPATCTAAQSCTKCGVVLAIPTGHKETSWIIDKEPTVYDGGSRRKECANCGATLETETIPKLYCTAVTDTYGEAVVGNYLVTTTDTNTGNPIANASVELNKDGSIAIRLPNSRLLDYACPTTVTVQQAEDKAPVKGVSLYITDKNENYGAGVTNASGQLTIPSSSGETNGSGNCTVGYVDMDGNFLTLTIKVERHKTGRPIKGAAVTVGQAGRITVALPIGADMVEDDRITITVTDNHKAPQEDVIIIVKDDLGNMETGKTDEYGKLTVPTVSKVVYHGAYIYGRPDGTFGLECDMTRGEAAAIFARLLSAKTGERIPAASHTRFSDTPADAWYSGYVRYLYGYGIAVGYGDNTYRPEAPITRAEFTAMAVRFFCVYGDGAADIMEGYTGFKDVPNGYWAAEYIKDAVLHGWIVGYGNGTFRGDASITRAEIVALVNRLLGREADVKYIHNNLHRLVTFADMQSKSHWAYYEVMEAANGHSAVVDDTESWNRH